MFEFQLKQIRLIPISIGLMCFFSSHLFAQNLQLYAVDGTTNDGSYFSLISGDGNTLTGSNGLGVDKPQFTFKINTQKLSYFSGNNTFTLPLAISNNGDLIAGRGNFTSANNVPYLFVFDATNASYSFTQIPIPSGWRGLASGINATGDSTIGYSLSNLNGTNARKGFLFSNNVLTPLRTDSLYSFPSAISTNGNVVVGATTISSTSTSPTLNQFIAFKYTNGVMQTLPQMASSYGSEATQVSQYGDVIAGIYYTTPSSTNTYRSFIYSGNVVRDIGTLGGVNTRVKGISASGDIIVGNSFINASSYHGFKYSGGVMQDLGTLGGLNSTVSAISANGYAIVGDSNTSNGTSHGYVFSNNIMRDLGTLGGTNSKATGVSDDGRVIVGQSQLANSNNWTTFYAYNPTDIIPNFSNPISDLGLTFYPRFDGGTLNIDSSSSTTKNFTITANHGFVDTKGNDVRFSGTISDDSAGVAGNLTILNTGNASSGKVIFSGENTYSGATSIASGAAVALAGSGSIANSSVLNNNGTFDISCTSSGASIKSLSGTGTTALGTNTLTLTNAANTYSGVMSGTGGLSISGGTQTLTGTNTYTGATSIASGAAVALAGSGSIANSSVLNNNGTFDISCTSSGASIKSLSGTGTTALGTNTLTLTNAANTYSGVMSGTGGLSISGGTQTLTGTNTYTGATSLNGGTLNLSGSLASKSLTVTSGTLIDTNGGLASGTNLMVNGGSVNINSDQTIANLNGSGGTVAIANGKTLNISNGGSFSGSIGGAGSVLVSGGTNTLSGINSQSGTTTINNGAQLNINSGLALGNGVLVLVGTATVPAIVSVSQTTSISNPITVIGDPTFNIATGTTTTIASVIADGTSSGEVVVSGGGTLALEGTNTYTGATVITNDSSSLVLLGNGSIANTSTLTNNSNFNITSANGNVALKSYTQSSTGKLSMNFSPTNNQQLNVNGPATVGGVLSLTASSGSYKAGKYTLLTASSLNGSFSGLSTNLGSYTGLGYDLAYDSSDVYLVLTPNFANTQASLQQMAIGLQSVYALQTSAINNSLGYDCTMFDTNGICVSAGGRYALVNTGDNGSNGLIIGAYKLNPQIRLGGYIDQNLTSSNVAPHINLGNGSPLFGVFGVWNDQADQLGYSVRVAAGYGDRDLSMTRQVIGTSESGSGSTRLNSQAASVEASYALAINPQWLATPYVGIRYTKINASAYTEQSSTAVTTPLSFDTLSQEYTTALAGLRVNGKVDSNFGLFAGAGIEQDLNNHGDNYSATGITGLTAINLNPNLQKTRAVANLGVFYEIDKAQRISFNAIYRQEAFQSTNTLTSLVTYIAGF